MNHDTKKGIIIILSICILYILIPKIFKSDCKSATESIKNEECEIKIESVKHISSFDIIGTNPENNEPCECHHYNRWWSSYKDEMEEGNYFIKKKGDLFFKIVKEDTVITHEYKCYEE
ncbi:hypothetical protein OK344_09175 [Kaistella sp. BT6-1-3]|uniref:Uncharacterized protein n=1 Tax=Kaistella yananensis TaxID=2989820 RepID=A0ABT3JNU5_9FLAO|nr:hypothetical protein [Kaistella yananensis]MCW4452381.1 hypothetical protein [Kaistella yananensis]